MSVYEKISGFADEISQDFDQQLKTVTDLGMKYICIRSAEHKGIADYTPEEVRTVLLPKLRAAGVGVSSLGTAIGKVEVDDEEGFAKQLEQLDLVLILELEAQVVIIMIQEQNIVIIQLLIKLIMVFL